MQNPKKFPWGNTPGPVSGRGRGKEGEWRGERREEEGREGEGYFSGRDPPTFKPWLRPRIWLSGMLHHASLSTHSRRTLYPNNRLFFLDMSIFDKLQCSYRLLPPSRFPSALTRLPYAFRTGGVYSGAGTPFR